MKVYTYEVKVVVNVLAESEEESVGNLSSGQGVMMVDKVETLIKTTDITVDQNITYSIIVI